MSAAVISHRPFQSELKRFIYTKKSLNENFLLTEILTDRRVKSGPKKPADEKSFTRDRYRRYEQFIVPGIMAIKSCTPSFQQ